MAEYVGTLRFHDTRLMNWLPSAVSCGRLVFILLWQIIAEGLGQAEAEKEESELHLQKLKDRFQVPIQLHTAPTFVVTCGRSRSSPGSWKKRGSAS